MQRKEKDRKLTVTTAVKGTTKVSEAEEVMRKQMQTDNVPDRQLQILIETVAEKTR